jgi:lipopolysaccharide/colanic/teichoic acid biosynthesis glycosyltransferase
MVLHAPNSGFYRRYGKRALDLCAAGTAMLLLLPVALLVAVLVRLFLGSPVLFRQTRPGLHGAPFTIVKFRSMAEARDRAGQLLPDAIRLTSTGRFLRSTSLDELPELWNVLTGDMSLVGPRPLLMAYLERYTPRQALRHSVPPGLTGLAQVSGRNALSWEQKFELDAQYVEQCSFWLDLRILFVTVSHVLLRRGISQPGHVTAEEFLGSAHPQPQPSSPAGGTSASAA